MAISGADLPQVIAERLEAYYPAPAIFTADEIVDWPDETLDGLLAAGLIQSGDRAEFVLCDGCHWGCFKPVVFKNGNAGPRAFVVCDEEPNQGRIGISLDRLTQYRSSLSLVAQFMRAAFGLKSEASLCGSSPLLLGDMKGRFGNPSVALLLQDRKIIVQVGTHIRPLFEFLLFRDGKIVADGTLLRKLANRKHGANIARPRYQSDRVKQHKKAQETTRRDRAIWAEAARLQATGMKISQISRQLARLRRYHETGDGPQRSLSHERIYRIIYEQRKKLGANFSAHNADPQATE